MVANRFAALSPDSVLDAVEAAGLRPTGHCSALRCLENRVYDVRLEDDSHVVVKFYRPGRWSRQAILDEHRFLLDLAEVEVPVCAPLPLAGGRTLHETSGFLYAIWPRTGGRSPDELPEDTLAILGRLLARIHNVGATRDAPHRLRVTPEQALLAPLAALEADLPVAYAGRYRAAVEAVARRYAEQLRDVPVHRIHGDCHRGNLLRGREGWFFLDFDDFGVGPAVYDVWVLAPGRDAEGERQRAGLLEGYRQFRDFDPAWLALVETLRALRYVRIASWVASHWDEPAFRSAFPHFGTDAYWESETRDLEEQLARIHGAGGAGSQAEPAAPAELTNADFFWDLRPEADEK